MMCVAGIAPDAAPRYRVHPTFIRRTRTRHSSEHSFTCRLVRSERSGAKVRQRTLLNPGRYFDVEPADWPALCRRVDDILAGAQRIAAQRLAHERPGTPTAPARRGDIQCVDVDSRVVSLRLRRDNRLRQLDKGDELGPIAEGILSLEVEQGSEQGQEVMNSAR